MALNIALMWLIMLTTVPAMLIEAEIWPFKEWWRWIQLFHFW